MDMPTVPVIESSDEVESDQEILSPVADLNNDMDETTTFPASHSDDTALHLSPISAGNAEPDGFGAEPDDFG
ncbi:hypothetical protein V6N13_072245 [Hibiscus sabdariffa]|uniref:Uncharacterized protein n=1 Tax=Hibiscus sabdariffa TaxID=183260 RepID=A0ABR2R860_9ROSI